METNHLDKQNFFDLGNLDSLRRDALNSGDASTDASKAALKKAAAQFEAIFTQMLLKSMRKANEAFEDKESPLMVALSTTTSSLQQCFSGKTRKIVYPNLWN